MTGYTVHTGASKKFVSGWDRIFGAEEADGKKKKTGKKSGKRATSAKKKKK